MSAEIKITLDRELVAEDGTVFEREARMGTAKRGEWVIAADGTITRIECDSPFRFIILTPKPPSKVRWFVSRADEVYAMYGDTLIHRTNPGLVMPCWPDDREITPQEAARLIKHPVRCLNCEWTGDAAGLSLSDEWVLACPNCGGPWEMKP